MAEKKTSQMKAKAKKKSGKKTTTKTNLSVLQLESLNDDVDDLYLSNAQTKDNDELLDISEARNQSRGNSTASQQDQQSTCHNCKECICKEWRHLCKF